MVISIKKSVGKNGVNDDKDVRIIQKVMQEIPERRGGTKGLPVNGRAGLMQTTKAILKF